MRLLAAALLLSVIVACDRKPRVPARDTVRASRASRESPDLYPMLDSLPLVADDVDVAIIDSTGLAGIALCAPLRDVKRVFPHAVGVLTYCPEAGCDAAYPAQVALTRAGDTLNFESQIPISGEPQDDEPRLHYAWTTSPRVASRIGVRPGITVARLRALGERVEIDSFPVTVIPATDSFPPDTVREGPEVLTLYLRREGLIAEVRDSMARVFGRRLMPDAPSIQALDTSALIAAIGVRRDQCPSTSR